jgi:hypothetical protein
MPESVGILLGLLFGLMIGQNNPSKHWSSSELHGNTFKFKLFCMIPKTVHVVMQSQKCHHVTVQEFNMQVSGDLCQHFLFPRTFPVTKSYNMDFIHDCSNHFEFQ